MGSECADCTFVTRAAAVIINDGCVALIERRRGDDVDYAFPGGQVELDESAPDTAVRKVREELGVGVSIGRLVAEIASPGDQELYYLAQITSGNFSKRDTQVKRGVDVFTPVWVPLFGLTALPVQPKAVALLAEFSGNGWPHEALRLTDRSREQRAAITIS